MSPNLISIVQRPLIKQLLGAVVGTVVALTLYAVYTLTAPPLTAFVSSVFASDQAGQGLTFSDADRKERRREIVEKAKGIIESELRSETL